MSTKFSTPKGKKPGKNNTPLPRVNWGALAKKAGGFAGTALLAAACGGTPKPVICPKAEGGYYLVAGDCVIPPSQEGSVDLDVVKEAKKTKQETAQVDDVEAKMDAASELFAREFLSGGIGWLNKLLEGSSRHYLEVESGATFEKHTQTMEFRITANEEEGKVTAYVFKQGDIHSRPGSKLPKNMSIGGNVGAGGANDDEVVTPYNAMSKFVENSTKVERSGDYTGRFLAPDPEKPGQLMMLESVAEPFSENRIFFVSAQHGKANINLLLLYNRESVSVAMVSEMNVANGVKYLPTGAGGLRFSKEGSKVPEVLAAFFQIGENAYFLLVPKNPGPDTNALLIPLLETSDGMYKLPFREDDTVYLSLINYNWAKEKFGGQ